MESKTPLTDNSTDNEEPDYELKITGDDLLDHDGLAWIRLKCPYCWADARFYARHTSVIKESALDPSGGHIRHFHTMASCERCNEIIYIKCVDWDWDPDWHFWCEYHYPRGIAKYLRLDDLPVSFSEAHTRLEAGRYLEVAAICHKVLRKLLEENGIDETITFSSGLKKLTSDLQLPDYDEISSLVDDVLHLYKEIIVNADNIQGITYKQARQYHDWATRIVHIVTNKEEIIKAQKEKMSTARKRAIPIDSELIPF